MGKELERTFALCLEALRRGESVESCLARYPHMVKELEPLLRTTSAVKQTTHVPMRSEFKAAARGRLLVSARSSSTQSQQHRHVIGWHWRWVAGLSAFLVVVLGWGTVVLANNSLPDETLYPVKIATEEVKIALTPGKIRKALLEADLIEERTREINELARMDKLTLIERANERLDRQLERLATIVASPEVESSQSQVELEVLVEVGAAKQSAALKKAIEKAPESAKPGLNRVLERSEDKQVQARQTIAEKKTATVKPDSLKPGGKSVPIAKARTLTPTPTTASGQPVPQRTPVLDPKATQKAIGQTILPKTPVPSPKSTQQPPVTTPKPTPVPKPRGFIKSDDGLASVECQPCSPVELQRYLERVHKQALSEGKPFSAIVVNAYTYVDNKPVKQEGKKLFRITENKDTSVRIEWECGTCDARLLESLLQRIENFSKSVMTITSPSKKVVFFLTVSVDAKKFNITLLSDKSQLPAKRPAMTTDYQWSLDNSTELEYRTMLAFNSAMRYTREDFIAGWLAIWISKGMSDEQYASRLTVLKSGKAYSVNVDSFNKTILAVDLMVALKAEGFNLEKLTMLIKMIEGKNVSWKQFKDTAKRMTGKELPTLNNIDKGVELWIKWTASHNQPSSGLTQR